MGSTRDGEAHRTFLKSMVIKMKELTTDFVRKLFYKQMKQYTLKTLGVKNNTKDTLSYQFSDQWL